MYITKNHFTNELTKITLEQPKARAQWLSEVLSGRKGGRMQDKAKHKSRARSKHDDRRGIQ